MVPVLTGHARFSPFRAAPPNADGTTILERDGVAVATIAFVAKPRFYNLQTFDGIAYWKLATLHGRDVLATTVLQSCVRYSVRATACQFCAIGQSLAEGRSRGPRVRSRPGQHVPHRRARRFRRVAAGREPASDRARRLSVRRAVRPDRGDAVADHAAPSAAFMRSVLEPLGAMLAGARLFAVDVKAGCARCNACSSLAAVYGG